MLLNINDIIIFIIVTIGFSWNKMSQMNKYIQIRKLTGIGNTKYIWISFLLQIYTCYLALITEYLLVHNLVKTNGGYLILWYIYCQLALLKYIFIKKTFQVEDNKNIIDTNC